MFESKEHHELVLQGEQYIRETTAESINLYRDDYAPLGSTPPLEGLIHQPDLIGFNDELLIIGEAKTEKDALTKHSKKQYEEYLLRCDEDPRKGYLYVFSSWKVKAAVADHLRIRSKQLSTSSVSWYVISEVELARQGIRNAKD